MQLTLVAIGIAMHLGQHGKGLLNFAKNVSICHKVDPL